MIAQRARIFKNFDRYFDIKIVVDGAAPAISAEYAHTAPNAVFEALIHILIHTMPHLSTPKYAKIHFFTSPSFDPKTRFSHTDMRKRRRENLSTKRGKQ